MQRSHKLIVQVALGTAAALASTAPTLAGSRTQGPAAQPGMPAISEDEARDIGVDAYIYGYPLVTVEMTRRVMTNVAAPEDSHAPMGQSPRCAHTPSRSGTT
jgi:hypothetical protein